MGLGFQGRVSKAAVQSRLQTTSRDPEQTSVFGSCVHPVRYGGILLKIGRFDVNW